MQKQTCAIIDCQSPRYCRGWCYAHYARWKRNGDPLAGKTARGALQQFVRDACSYAGDECLTWHQKSDYISVTINGQVRAAHRVVCEAVHGAPPNPALDVAHSCGNKHCLTPGHLRWATDAENWQDRIIHRVDNFGERNPLAKLTEADVIKIRSLEGSMPQAAIGRMFGVKQACISQILLRKTWARLSPRPGG